MTDNTEESTERRVLIYLDLFKRTCIGEVMEDLEDVYMLKAPAYLNHQLVPQQGPDGKPVEDPNRPGKPLLQIHTMWVPFCYAESLADKEAGFVIPIEKKGLTELEGVLRPALEHTYRVNTMGEGRAEEPAPTSPPKEENKPIPLFGGA